VGDNRATPAEKEANQTAKVVKATNIGWGVLSTEERV
jgi:hypothetical protein